MMKLIIILILVQIVGYNLIMEKTKH